MPIAQVNAGDRINASDLNAYYNLLKGVAASGEGITLIYNAAGVLILQPSSDPAAGTEFIQVKNNAGTVQMALSSDGKHYSADGVVGTPGYAYEGEKTTGQWRPAASTLAWSLGGTEAMRITATALTLAAAASRIVPGVTSLSLRNNANSADNILITDAGVVTVRSTLAATALTVTGGSATGNGMFQAAANSLGLFGGSLEVLRIDGTNGYVDFRNAVTALGGGAAPTVGTIGGSGPGTAGQNSWLKIEVQGVATYIPVWR